MNTIKKEKLLSFNQKTKDKYIASVKAHQKADRIIKGPYWQNGKGSAIGCTLEGDDHTKYETELGIPKEIAYLEDAIFEGLPNEEAMKFPLQFLQAVPINTDLSHVIAKFVIWQFEDEKYGLKNIKEAKDDKKTYGFCEEVVSLYKRTLTEEVSEEEFHALCRKIDAGTGAWAWARAGAGTGAGTWAWARDWARIRGGDIESQYEIMADKLIELLDQLAKKTQSSLA